MRIGLAYHRHIPDNRQAINRIKNVLYRLFPGIHAQAEVYAPDDQNITSFEISPEDLSFFKVFHSAFATPGRYVMEIFIRLSSLDTDTAEGCFIFNPFFNISRDVLDKVLDVVKPCQHESVIQVLCDAKRVPIGYLFPKTISTDDSRYLSLLSTMDADTDAEFLRNAFLTEAQCTCVPGVNLNKRVTNNGFYYNRYFESIYTWSTTSAIKALSVRQGCCLDNSMIGSLNHAEIERLNHQRNAIPFVAIMPHHAGDVLFFALAAKQVKTHIKKIVVNTWYVDIMRECAPEIIPVPLDLRPPIRDGNLITEEEYFWDVVALLPDTDIGNNFYYFCRPSSNYQISAFHLIDHFAFALGSSFASNNALFRNRAPATITSPTTMTGVCRILLHFEGGWPLKMYPPKHRQSLIQMLLSQGFEITVLTSSNEYTGDCHTERYTDLSHFKQLLSAHHLLIGMDSFPVHYAVHVAAFPAICLFGNTKPVNSDAHLSPRYVFLENELDCAGCGGYDKCPMNRRAHCNNFPQPNQVYAAATAMLDNLYGPGVKSSGCLQ